jgi:hypothetical protein
MASLLIGKFNVVPRILGSQTITCNLCIKGRRDYYLISARFKTSRSTSPVNKAAYPQQLQAQQAYQTQQLLNAKQLTPAFNNTLNNSTNNSNNNNEVIGFALPHHHYSHVLQRLPSPDFIPIYSCIKSTKFQIATGLIAAQSAVWLYCLTLSLDYPDIIPWWTGPLGLVSTVIFAAMYSLHCSRNIAIISRLQSDPNKVNIQTHSMLGKLVSHIIPFSDIDNSNEMNANLTNSKARGNRNSWTIRLNGYRGTHLIDREGVIYNPETMKKIVGYSVKFDPKQLMFIGNLNNPAFKNPSRKS